MNGWNGTAPQYSSTQWRAHCACGTPLTPLRGGALTTRSFHRYAWWKREDFADKKNCRRLLAGHQAPCGHEEAATSYDNQQAWSSKQKNQSLTQSQFDKLWAMTIHTRVATKKGFRKSKPAADTVHGLRTRKLLHKELRAKLEAEAAAVQTNCGA